MALPSGARWRQVVQSKEGRSFGFNQTRGGGAQTSARLAECCHIGGCIWGWEACPYCYGDVQWRRACTSYRQQALQRTHCKPPTPLGGCEELSDEEVAIQCFMTYLNDIARSSLMATTAHACWAGLILSSIAGGKLHARCPKDDCAVSLSENSPQGHQARQAGLCNFICIQFALSFSLKSSILSPPRIYLCTHWCVLCPCNHPACMRCRPCTLVSTLLLRSCDAHLKFNYKMGISQELEVTERQSRLHAQSPKRSIKAKSMSQVEGPAQ